MKIIGLAVLDTAAGREITVKALVDNNEVLDGSEVGQMLDVIRESENGAQAGDGAETAGRRGRRTGGKEAAEETPPPATRRRGGAASATSNASATASDNADQPSEPSTSRRRRGGSSETAATTVTEEPARRRRTAPPAPPEPEGISDADLAKACSEAGRVITPALVLQIMQEDHGVKLANQIPQEEREKFLETLDAEVRAVEAEG